jgi:hypothetical protein
MGVPLDLAPRSGAENLDLEQKTRPSFSVSGTGTGEKFLMAPFRGQVLSQSVILAFGYPDLVAVVMDASRSFIAQREPVVGRT